MRTLVIYPQQQRLWCSDTGWVEEESRDVFNSNGEVYENACDLPPAAETVAVPQAVEEESRDVLTAMERSMRELVIYPQQQRLWCSDTGCRGGE